MNIQKKLLAERYTLIEHERQSFKEQFAQDVSRGLTANSKTIPNFYVYDERGSLLFDQISKSSEYYIRGADERILSANAAQMVAQLAGNVALVELGSGNSEKTQPLLEALLQRQSTLTYVPIDISSAVFDESNRKLVNDYPGLNILGIAGGTYQDGLSIVQQEVALSKLILWLSSDLGQMFPEQAVEFLKNVRPTLGEGGEYIGKH